MGPLPPTKLESVFPRLHIGDTDIATTTGVLPAQAERLPNHVLGHFESHFEYQRHVDADVSKSPLLV